MHAVLSISIQLSPRLRRGFQIMFEFSWHLMTWKHQVSGVCSQRVERKDAKSVDAWRPKIVFSPVGWCFLMKVSTFKTDQKSACWFLASISWCLFSFIGQKATFLGCFLTSPVIAITSVSRFTAKVPLIQSVIQMHSKKMDVGSVWAGYVPRGYFSNDVLLGGIWNMCFFSIHEWMPPF